MTSDSDAAGGEPTDSGRDTDSVSPDSDDGGRSVEATAQSVKETAQSAEETAQSVKETAQSVKEPAQSVKEPAQSVKEPAQSVKTDGGQVPRDEVHHVAQLARVNVTDEEAEQFASQFADILSSFEALDEVPAVDAEPELTNVMRPDEVQEGLDRDAALANAPETEEGYFKGPRVS